MVTPAASRARIERQQRASQFLSLRVQGHSMEQIGAAQNPPISKQAVSAAIKVALRDIVVEPLEAIRGLEVLRLDEMFAGIYENALNGDIACIDRCLSIMVRRARLLGLDLQMGSSLRFSRDGRPVEVDDDGNPVLRLKIVNDPEHERMRWLQEERERLLALVGDNAPTTVN
jgi:hypothetical protein